MGIFDLLGGAVSAFGAYEGAKENAQAQEQINQQNIAMQEAFAQNGIQWKVEDAKKAGINPLAALGASTSSFSNVVAPEPGAGLGAAGQALGRAIQSTQSADDREYTDATRRLALQKASLENDLLASQLRTQNQPGDGPPTPAAAQKYLVEGQGPTVVRGTSAQNILVKPSESSASSVNDPTLEAAAAPSVKFLRSGDYWSPIPSKEAQGATFGSDAAGWIWDVQNRWSPAIGMNRHPPYNAPAGKAWGYDPINGYFLYSTTGSRTRWEDLNPFSAGEAQ